MPNRRKPIALHRLAGTYQPSRHAHRALEPEAPGDLALTGPPEWLTERQRELWADILSRAPRGILRAIDAELLANYCELVDRYITAAKAQAECPLVNADGVMSPYLSIMNRAIPLITKLAAQMGFTPVARTTLGVPMTTFRETAASEHELFDVVLPTGERIPYGARGNN